MKRSPIEPETVTSPIEDFSGYFAETSTGSRSPPIERIVTPDAPVSGVKKARTKVVTMASPPGSQPKSASKLRISLRLAPPSARM